MLSPRTPRARKGADRYGFELDDSAIKQYHVFVHNNEQTDERKLLRYEQCFFDIDMGHKDRVYSQLVRTGIPAAMRRREWLESSGVEFQIEKESAIYEFLLETATKDDGVFDVVSEADRDQIDKDVRRIGSNCVIDSTQMAGHIRNVSLALCAFNDGDGYTQGQNSIIASFMLLKFTEQEAFHLLRYVCDVLFPMSFTPTLIGAHVDVEILTYYLRFKAPRFTQLVNSHEIPPEHFPTRFVMTLGFGILPQESCYRVWDRMICGGTIEFFKCVIKILQHIGVMHYQRHNNGRRQSRLDTAMVMVDIDSKLRNLVDITPILNHRISGKPIEVMCLNKRRNKLRRIRLHREKGVPEKRESTNHLRTVTGGGSVSHTLSGSHESGSSSISEEDGESE